MKIFSRPNDKEIVYICPYCGKFRIEKKTWAKDEVICICCKKNDLMPTNIAPAYIRSNRCDKDEILSMYFSNDEIRQMKSHCRAIEKAKNMSRRESAQESHQVRTPTCPTCHSPDIVKIGSAERAGSVLLFGVFSSKINKQFECKNCGYKW